MDGNKDEALKCIGIAKEAIAAGNKDRSLKFIKIAQRLNSSLSVDDLLASCEKLDSGAPGPQNGKHRDTNQGGGSSAEKSQEGTATAVNGEQINYTEEHVQLIRQINYHKDYYAVLGVEKTCSVEEVRKAYRKLSLKVHPDKNKAPGAEEAFKKVSKAFKCLSEEELRRQYDQMGHVEDYEYNRQNGVRRRSATNGFYEEDFDPDEIFRAFFGQTSVFGTTHVFRNGGMGAQHRTDANVGGGPSLMGFFQLLPVLLIFLLAYLPFSEPEYSLQKNYTYQIPRVTERYGVGYYVKSLDFDQSYPVGSAVRIKIEEDVIRDYISMLRHYCHVELQRRHWSRNVPTPHCEKLQSLGTV